MSSNNEKTPPADPRNDEGPSTTNNRLNGVSVSVNPSKSKRKRPFGESLNAAYSCVASFTARTSTGRPDSPHFFFKSSYAVSLKNETNIGIGDGSTNSATEHHDPAKQRVEDNVRIPQAVHQHVNGLCIVTVAESIMSSLPPCSTIQTIRFVAQEARPCSAAEKRKKQSKMLKGGKVDDAVLPSTVIAELVVVVEEAEEELGHDTTTEQVPSSSPTGRTAIIPLYACVWGTILELNSRLTPELLMEDPLLDGYLAIILPSGRFPPSSSMMITQDGPREDDVAEKVA